MHYVIVSHALHNTLSSQEDIRLAAAYQACVTTPQVPDKLGQCRIRVTLLCCVVLCCVVLCCVVLCCVVLCHAVQLAALGCQLQTCVFHAFGCSQCLPPLACLYGGFVQHLNKGLLEACVVWAVQQRPVTAGITAAKLLPGPCWFAA